MSHDKCNWQKPKTTKVYLQHPLAERIALLCPDFKLLNLPLIISDAAIVPTL